MIKRRLFAISLAVASVAGCTQAPPAPTTSSFGMATLRVHVIAEPKAGAAQPHATVSSFDQPTARSTGDFTKVDYADLSQIVVWAEPKGGVPRKFLTPPELHLTLNRPKPIDSVTDVACVGQHITIINGTASPVRYYSVSDGNDFQLDAIQPGATGSITVKAAGTIEVLSESAAEPVAIVEAVPSPYFRMAHAGDDLTFLNLEPGEYRIVAWHPRLPGSETSIQLSADRTTETQVRIGVNALPKVGPN